MLPSNECLWPLLLPEDCQQRRPLKISLMLERSYQVIEWFLHHLEMQKPSSRWDIQANFPFPFAIWERVEVAEEWTVLHVVVKTRLCLLLPVPVLQNTRVFPVAKLASLPNYSMHPMHRGLEGVGAWKKASASLPGTKRGHTIPCSTETKSLLLIEEKCYFPW